MHFESWHLWVIAIIIFIVLEIVVPAFVMTSIAIGCFFAFAGAVFHAPLALQLILFCIGTIVGFVGVRPVMVRYAYQKKGIETNASGLIGRLGKVVEEIDPKNETGRVAVDGDFWKAVSFDDKIIPVGQKVKIVKLDSIVVTVEPIEPIFEDQSPAVETTPLSPDKKITVKIGNKTSFIGFDEVLYIYSKNKITFIVTRTGKEFIHDESLDKLDNQLPRNVFFKANRQFILSRHIISEIKPIDNGKVNVSFKDYNSSSIDISVSRLKAHAFREWMKRS
jgi:membrane protein implicated in regulation of membrane protease activity